MKWLLLALLCLLASGCMRVPAGLHVIVTDQPETYCRQRVNCYLPSQRAIVVVPDQSIKLWAHEACHAHQHQTVLDAGLTASDDLHEWYGTAEATAYRAVAEAAPVPAEWNLSAPTLLEDFAEACGRYLTGWQDREPGRDKFFAAGGF